MSVRLGSNIASLTAQRRLAEGTSSLARTYERLSSGQRINRASDDAAGLAIADSLKVGSRIFNQGVRNLNDGISLLNIADSAIETLAGIMTRLEELAEQAANGTYGVQQRKALNAEAQALSKEFFRISKTTSFNGQQLLSGTLDQVNLQAGFGANSVLSPHFQVTGLSDSSPLKLAFRRDYAENLKRTMPAYTGPDNTMTLTIEEFAEPVDRLASRQSSSPEKPDPGPGPEVTPPITPTPGTPEPGDPPRKGPGDPPPSKPKPASPTPIEPKSATGLVDPRDLTGEHGPISLPEEPTAETPDAEDADDSSHDVKPLVQGMVDPRL